MTEVFRIMDESSHTDGWYAKGNYTLQEMIAGIDFEDGEDFLEEDEKKNLKLEHCYLRCVPVSKYDDLPFAYYLLYSKKGRGAFEATRVNRE
jgi:hypothetical protein